MKQRDTTDEPWRVHVIGPDDILEAESYADALHKATEINQIFLREAIDPKFSEEFSPRPFANIARGIPDRPNSEGEVSVSTPWALAQRAHVLEETRRLTGEGTSVALEIAAERARQVEVEGWLPAHDDQHELGELADGAIAYILAAAVSEAEEDLWSLDEAIDSWPWEIDTFKPSDARRNLIKAAALLVAEVERLDRRRAFEPAA